MRGIKKTPREWYERLNSNLIKIGFSRISDNSNLYLKCESKNMVLIVEIFVDDIIFGGNDMFSKTFVDQMNKEFEISMFGEINFIIGLQVHQIKNDIYVTQSKHLEWMTLDQLVHLWCL